MAMNALARIAMLLFAVACFHGRAAAQEAEPFRGIFCDSADQIRLVVTRGTELGGAAQGIEAVNAEVRKAKGENTPAACIHTVITGVRGKELAVIDTPDGKLAIVPFLVTAVRTPFGMIRPDKEMVWFTLAEPQKPKGQEARLWLASERLLGSWYEQQSPTPETKKIYNLGWVTCCDVGDVCKNCIVHRYSDKPPWTEGFWYEKDGEWKQLPPHIVEHVPWTPTGKPVLFLAPYNHGKIKKDEPLCLKVPGGGV
jgi:hypothetical protein